MTSEFGSCSNDSYFSSDKSEGAESPMKSRKRKNPHPKKSPSLHDSNFKGVLINMAMEFKNGQWKFAAAGLFIPSKNKLVKTRRRKRRKIYFSCSESDDDEVPISILPSTSSEKHCASCRAKKTPLWRDAEDGTPLCNACGIRYKKYKVRCEHCWHIPKKDEVSPLCKSCGSFLQCHRFGSW